MLLWLLVIAFVLALYLMSRAEGYSKTPGQARWWGRTHGDGNWGRRVGWKGYRGWRGKSVRTPQPTVPIVTGTAAADTTGTTGAQDGVATGLNTAAEATTSGVGTAADATAGALTTAVNVFR